jgi:hypothetical protein
MIDPKFCTQLATGTAQVDTAAKIFTVLCSYQNQVLERRPVEEA